MNFSNLRQIYKKEASRYNKIHKASYYFRFDCSFCSDMFDYSKIDTPYTYQIIHQIQSLLTKNNKVYEINEDSSDKMLNSLLVDVVSIQGVIPRNSFYRGIKPLIDQNVIVKYDKSRYTVNPYYFHIFSEKQFTIFLNLTHGFF